MNDIGQRSGVRTALWLLLGSLPLIGFLAIVPLSVLLAPVSSALFGAGIFALLIVLQVPIFFALRRFLPRSGGDGDDA